MTPAPLPSRPRAVGAALLVTFLWSSSWVLIRWGLDDESLEPLTFAALRYGAATVILGMWVLARPRARAELARVDRSTLVRIAVLGLVFYALTQGAQFVAIDSQPAATTSLVLSWTPLAVALAGSRAIAERAGARQLAGSGLVVTGAWLFFSGELGATSVGMAAALVALGANVVASLLGRGVNRTGAMSPAVVTVLSMGVGAALLLAVGWAVEGAPRLTWQAGLLIAWLAAVNTALAFTLWNYSLRRLAALESAAINNTMLIQIALLAWLFLDEPLGWGEIAGIVVVSAGILLAQAGGPWRSGQG